MPLLYEAPRHICDLKDFNFKMKITKRPETITLGTNELVGTKPENIKPYLEKVLSGSWKKGGEIPLWDGKTAERIVNDLLKIYSN